jgi:hypothetical protein
VSTTSSAPGASATSPALPDQAQAAAHATAGDRPGGRAGDAHAARALALLARWNRAANWHLMFAGPCSCCVGDAQLAHLENQAIAIMLERVAGQPALESLLVRCRDASIAEPTGARSLGRLMRAVVTERDPVVSGGHAILLDAFEAVLENLEGDGT